jgi:hypothetical protein
MTSHAGLLQCPAERQRCQLLARRRDRVEAAPHVEPVVAVADRLIERGELVGVLAHGRDRGIEQPRGALR